MCHRQVVDAVALLAENLEIAWLRPHFVESQLELRIEFQQMMDGKALDMETETLLVIFLQEIGATHVEI